MIGAGWRPAEGAEGARTSASYQFGGADDPLPRAGIPGSGSRR
jgi:hypothetical protein